MVPPPTTFESSRRKHSREECDSAGPATWIRRRSSAGPTEESETVEPPQAAEARRVRAEALMRWIERSAFTATCIEPDIAPADQGRRALVVAPTALRGRAARSRSRRERGWGPRAGASRCASRRCRLRGSTGRARPDLSRSTRERCSGSSGPPFLPRNRFGNVFGKLLDGRSPRWLVETAVGLFFRKRQKLRRGFAAHFSKRGGRPSGRGQSPRLS